MPKTLLNKPYESMFSSNFWPLQLFCKLSNKRYNWLLYGLYTEYSLHNSHDESLKTQVWIWHFLTQDLVMVYHQNLRKIQNCCHKMPYKTWAASQISLSSPHPTWSLLCSHTVLEFSCTLQASVSGPVSLMANPYDFLALLPYIIQISVPLLSPQRGFL